MTPLEKVSLACMASVGALAAVFFVAVILALYTNNGSASPFFAATLIVLVVVAAAEALARHVLQNRAPAAALLSKDPPQDGQP